jgi:excisionase family DNA binding protein
MPVAKSLTTKEVARLCRVSDATVKRWEDAGVLNSERTSGGHRRFRADEVARFQREQNLGLKLSHGDESAVKAKIRRREHQDRSHCELFHSLVAGAEEEASSLLISACLNGEPLTRIFDDLICLAMKCIGELWYKGELSVAQEHLATRTAYNAIHKMRLTLPVPEISGELAMCCGVEGDFHELPTHLAQMTIENEGWEVLNFGANTPLYSFAEEVLQYTPKIICVAATLIPDIERLSRDYKDFRERICKLQIPVLIGGRAFSDEQLRKRFPAEFYAENFTDVVKFVKRISLEN